jgi:hypothetical protein
VSSEAIRHYEKLRDEFERDHNTNRPRIGFCL